VPGISIPTLILQGKLDTVVEPREATWLHDHLGAASKSLVILPRSDHVVAVDRDRERVVALTREFVLGRGSSVPEGDFDCSTRRGATGPRSGQEDRDRRTIPPQVEGGEVFERLPVVADEHAPGDAPRPQVERERLGGGSASGVAAVNPNP
jgi:hypothetical protein